MRKKRRLKTWVKVILCLLLAGAVAFGFAKRRSHIWQSRFFTGASGMQKKEALHNVEMPDWVDVQLIHIHNTARTGTELDQINNVVIHYVGNPGSTAQNNRDYFDKESTTVSSHFVVGLEGEVIQCLPLWERSAASNRRNSDTVSIEVCHPDESGKFSETTYDAVVKLTAFLLKQLDLSVEDVIRHYDITGKLCPLYYVEHEDAWETLKKDLQTALSAI